MRNVFHCRADVDNVIAFHDTKFEIVEKQDLHNVPFRELNGEKRVANAGNQKTARGSLPLELPSRIV